MFSYWHWIILIILWSFTLCQCQLSFFFFFFTCNVNYNSYGNAAEKNKQLSSTPSSLWPSEPLKTPSPTSSYLLLFSEVDRAVPSARHWAAASAWWCHESLAPRCNEAFLSQTVMHYGKQPSHPLHTHTPPSSSDRCRVSQIGHKLPTRSHKCQERGGKQTDKFFYCTGGVNDFLLSKKRRIRWGFIRRNLACRKVNQVRTLGKKMHEKWIPLNKLDTIDLWSERKKKTKQKVFRIYLAYLGQRKTLKTLFLNLKPSFII